MKNLLAICEKEKCKENKIKTALQIYNLINHNLNKVIKIEGIDRWIVYVCTVFNKILEFEDQRNSGAWNKVDKILVENFVSELNKTKEFSLNIIKNYNGLLSYMISQTKEKILELESRSSRRNIKRVDYTGMDSIEPKSEFDLITNIWADETIVEDPDYVFIEDQTDEEDEYEENEYNKCQQNNLKKAHPKLNIQDKSDLKQHLTQLVDHDRVRRSVARVNYAEMDTNEYDEGEIHVSKRCFKDGKVKYIWKSYSLSQANEIGDEDYVDEY